MFVGRSGLFIITILSPSSLSNGALKSPLFFSGLLVLSSVVVRAMHHYLGTPLWVEDLVKWWCTAQPTLLWVILAFYPDDFSSRRHIRKSGLWVAALLGIVVAKLLLLDLSQSGTLTRVISRLLGRVAVMLVIAYLAPLPPALEENQRKRLINSLSALLSSFWCAYWSTSSSSMGWGDQSKPTGTGISIWFSQETIAYTFFGYSIANFQCIFLSTHIPQRKFNHYFPNAVTVTVAFGSSMTKDI